MDIVISGLVGIVLGAVGAYFVIRNNRTYFENIEGSVNLLGESFEDLADQVRELAEKVSNVEIKRTKP